MNINRKGPLIDPGLCRCCGSMKKCRLLNVEYDWFGRKEIYSDIFMDCFGLLLCNLDGEQEERLICATCVNRLREASCFRQQVLECEEKLLRSKVEDQDKQKEGYNSCNNLKEENTDFFTAAASDNDLSEYDVETDYLLLIRQPEEDTEPKGKQKVKSKNDSEEQKEMLLEMKRTKDKFYSLRAQSNIERIAENTETNEQLKHLNKEKALMNLITIIEYSYVCPFSSFFNNIYCLYCREKFVIPDAFREHSATHDSSTFKELFSANVTRRRKFQIDVKRIDCRLCDMTIKDIDTFKNHISNDHGKVIHSVPDDFLKFELAQVDLKCIECEQTFPNIYVVYKHMAEHFGEYICDICGMHYFEERLLNAHRKSHKPRHISHSCQHCDKTFRSKYNLYIHEARVHTKQSIFLCRKCDETFFSDTLRQKHMIKVHGEESVFKCDCGKVFDSKRNLRGHVRTNHMKAKEHQCNLCDKKFNLPSKLKEHISCHNDERNFRCEHCGKSFLRSRTLKVHMEIHKAVKKYKCGMCNASFSQNVCLKNHVKKQHVNCEIENEKND